MNDFTKEELEKLYALALVHDNETVSDLRNKLQSMIDGYDSLDSIRKRTNLHGGCSEI